MHQNKSSPLDTEQIIYQLIIVIGILERSELKDVLVPTIIQYPSTMRESIKSGGKKGCDLFE